jgi:hypothetical protein
MARNKTTNPDVFGRCLKLSLAALCALFLSGCQTYAPDPTILTSVWLAGISVFLASTILLPKFIESLTKTSNVLSTIILYTLIAVLSAAAFVFSQRKEVTTSAQIDVRFSLSTFAATLFVFGALCAGALALTNLFHSSIVIYISYAAFLLCVASLILTFSRFIRTKLINYLPIRRPILIREGGHIVREIHPSAIRHYIDDYIGGYGILVALAFCLVMIASIVAISYEGVKYGVSLAILIFSASASIIFAIRAFQARSILRASGLYVTAFILAYEVGRLALYLPALFAQNITH